MVYLSRKISKNYAIELSCFHFLRKFSDGISFAEFDINLDLFKSDHNPKFKIILIMLNFKIFEFEVYNVNHVL